MTREQLHNRAQLLTLRLLQLPTFCRGAIFPEGKIEVQRFFENLILEQEVAILGAELHAERMAVKSERNRVKKLKRKNAR